MLQAARGRKNSSDTMARIMPEYIAALDQGTTSTRLIIFDHAGKIVSCAQREHVQYYPQPGWVEHDAREIWQRTLEVMEEALQQSKLHLREVAAIGITNQRETAVLWDRRTGEPVANALVWQDTRVAEDAARLGREIGEDFF